MLFSKQKNLGRIPKVLCIIGLLSVELLPIACMFIYLCVCVCVCVRVCIVYNCIFQFVAHPNCQQHLTSIWYGNEMGFLQSAVWMKKAGLVIIWIPALPFLCLAYIINPYSKVSTNYRCMCVYVCVCVCVIIYIYIYIYMV